jgi:15-cis-phytoene synthase
MLNTSDADKKMISCGYRLAAGITRKEAHSFYFASHILPRKTRNAAYAVYAFCRKADESVDGRHLHPDLFLEKIKNSLADAYSGASINEPMLAAFRNTVTEYGIPREYFAELIKGMEMDLVNRRYEEFENLKEYCYRAAGVIGLIMLKIFRADEKECSEAAVNLGIAMQLTNMLRDIKEDYSLGRIYIPQRELKEFGVAESDIAGSRMTPEFRKLIRFQIERARRLYALSASAEKFIPGKRERLTASLMREIYSGILTQIEKNGCDVFAGRATVGIGPKAWILIKTLMEGCQA